MVGEGEGVEKKGERRGRIHFDILDNTITWGYERLFRSSLKSINQLLS